MAILRGDDGDNTLDQRGVDSADDYIDGAAGNDTIFGSLSDANMSNRLTGGLRLVGKPDDDVITGGRGFNTFVAFLGNDQFNGHDRRMEPDFNGFGDRIDFSSTGTLEDQNGIGYGGGVGSVTVDLGAGTYSADVWMFRAPTPTAPAHVTTGTFSQIYQVATARGVAGDARYADQVFGSDNSDGIFEVFDTAAGDDVIDGRGGFDFVSYSLSSLTGFELTGVTVDLKLGAGRDRSGDIDMLKNIEGIIGSPMADNMLGNSGDNIFRPGGTTGATQGDKIIGRGGSDLVDYAGQGAVKIDLEKGRVTNPGGTPDRLIDIENAAGSSNDDTLIGDGGENRLYGRDGNDLLIGGDEFDRLAGGNGDDDLRGGKELDWLDGGPGVDKIDGGGGKDALHFDLDEFLAPPTGVTVSFEDGEVIDPWGNTDTFVNIEAAVGTDFRDVMTGSDGDEEMYGREGDDQLTGGAGKDRIEGQGGQDLIFGGDGDDLLYGGDGEDKLYGEDGKDRIFGDDGKDRIWGEDGDDYIQGGAEDDKIKGGDGNDSLIGDSGNDVIEGGFGNDILTGGRGDSKLYGGFGDDRLLLTTGDTLYNGGFGHDMLDVSERASRLVVVEVRSAGVTVDLARGEAVYDVNRMPAKLKSIEGVIGSEFRDVVNGSSRDNTLNGFGGDDELRGRGGADELDGGDGQDRLRGDGGKDQLAGGRGEDYLWGGAGKDRLRGGSEDDRLEGGGARDRLEGGSGNDTLYGGSGNDILIGNEGADRFVMSRGNDEILDFDPAEDLIVVNAAAAQSYSDLAAVAQDVADKTLPNVIIDAGSAVLEIRGLSFAQLSDDNFLFL